MTFSVAAPLLEVGAGVGEGVGDGVGVEEEVGEGD